MSKTISSRAGKLVLTIVTVIILTLTVYIGVSAQGESHNLYTDPIMSGTSGKFDAFVIDFKTDSENALGTYWALANYSFDTSASERELGYKNLQSPAGYAGLQCRNYNTDRVGIMSIWQYTYTDSTGKEVVLNAERVYPKGSDSFDNEGSGVKCIENYAWADHQWYRMLLMCWEDEELGRTFAGTWFYDYSAEKWTLFCYYNLGLVDSYFKGGFSQFQENFSQYRKDVYRSFNYTNFYVFDHTSKKWISTPNIYLSSCTYPDKVGVVGGGLSEDGKCITGFADGYRTDEEYVKLGKTYTILQPSTPTFGTPEIERFTVRNSITKTAISWSMTGTSTPQLSYKLTVIDEGGREILSKSQTRPEVNSLTVDSLGIDKYRATLTVTDVFGNKTSAIYETPGYNYTGTVVTPEPTPTPEPDIPDLSDAERVMIQPYYGKVENWSGKTYFITGIVSSNNDTLFKILRNKEGTLRVKITAQDGSTYCIPQYFFDNPGAEFYDTSFLRLAVAEYGIPVVSGGKYTLYIDVVSDGKIIYYGESETGAFDGSAQDDFAANGPIIPAVVPHSYTTYLPDVGTVVPDPFDSELVIIPIYGQIENWNGKTWFITEVNSSDNTKLYGNLKNKTWKADIIIKDETTLESRIIKGYEFDDAGNEIYATTFFRFAVCEYGIIPVLGHSYTVTVNVYDGEELIASGTSATGAFNSFNDTFKSDGPVVPENPTHSSEIYGDITENKTGLITEDGIMYYYSDGEKQTGWFTLDGVRYYADPTTKAVVSGSNAIISTKQYLWDSEKGLVLANGFYENAETNKYASLDTSNGKAVIVTVSANGTVCFENGYLVYGWRHVDGSSVSVVDGVYEQYSTNPQNLYYFLSSTYTMVTSDSYVLGGWTREFNADHTVKPLNGLQNRYGEVYYYVDGTMQDGWQTVNGNTYYFYKGTGKAATKWAIIGGKVYYFYAGSSATPYALKTSGTIGGINYTYTADGSITTTGFYNAEYANKANNNSATYIQHKDATTMYYENGVRVEGWAQIGGNWYYFYKGTGLMCTESRTIGGVWYEFTSEGVCTSK